MVSCSVLMTVYSKEKPEYLKAALESIYENQTRKPDEIVVVFDGKLTDELYKVLNDFRLGKEDVVFYYPQEVNQGPGGAARIGCSKCTKDYIFRMDSDDICLSDRFEKQLEYVEKNPEIDVLGADIAEFVNSPNEITHYRICPQKHNDIVKMGKKRCPMNHVTACIKRSSLEKCGGYEPLIVAEDYFLWTKMIAANCKLENLNETLVYVRIGKDFSKKRAASVQIKSWQKIQAFMVKNKMISMAGAIMNMIYILGFTYCPNFVREFAYNKLFRKQSVPNTVEQGNVINA